MAQEKQDQTTPSYAKILKTEAPAKLIKNPRPKINEIQVHEIKEFVASQKFKYGLGASINEIKTRIAKAKPSKEDILKQKLQQ